MVTKQNPYTSAYYDYYLAPKILHITVVQQLFGVVKILRLNYKEKTQYRGSLDS